MKRFSGRALVSALVEIDSHMSSAGVSTICNQTGKRGAHLVPLFEKNNSKVKEIRNMQSIHSGQSNLPSVPASYSKEHCSKAIHIS